MQILRSAVLAAAGLLLQQATAAPLTAMTTTVSRAVEERATRTVNEVTLFSPPSDAGWVDPRVLYARAVSLSSGALLATWENYSPEPPLVYFPIYRSTDGGATWAEIGRVQDTVNNWGLRYQPTLFELPQAFGRFPKGTVLAAGNSIPTDLSQTKIDVYASTDGGATWAFVSSVASGGEARPNNGLTPVWEPLFFVYDNQLVCYYSDQRDPQHGQKLVHQTTTDLLSWGPLVDDVAEADYEMRPGMPAVTRLPDGNYLFAYEMCGPGGGCRVHVRRAPSPLAMLNAPDYALRSDRGTYPVSSPNVVWSRAGGPDGAVVLSSGSGPIFVNRQLGDPAAWTEHATPAPGAYSRGLALLQDDDNALVIIGAGHLPPSSTNKVTVSVVDLAATIGA